MLLALADTRHDYRDCDDEHCDAFPCRVYREGRERGVADGFDAGYARGYTEGYDAACADASGE